MIGYLALGNFSDGASQVLKPLRLVLCSRLVTPWEVRKTLDSPGKSVKSLETETMGDMDYKPVTFTLVSWHCCPSLSIGTQLLARK